MSEQQQTLKWGDVVRIHGVNLSKKNLSKGLVLSKGFTDSNIYYQKYAEFDAVNFYRQSLFQLLPRSNFDVHDQLLDQNLSQQQRQILKLRSVSQIQGLYTNLKRVAGTQIKYGAEVVFRHVQSNSYLRGVMKAADTGDGAFKIQVTQNISSQSLFRLRSHRSYEHQGDKIYYDDALLIYHDSADCYMNFAQNDKPVALDQPYENVQPQKRSAQEEYSTKRPNIKRPADKRISIINENKSKCLWKFILHCNFENYQQKNKIKSHDIVYFQHTKNKGMISSSLSKKQFYLKQSNSNQKGLSFECFWQLIPQQVNEVGPQNCQKFWVRNTITGNFLEYNDYRVEIQSKNPVQGGGFISSGLVNLLCTPGKQKRKLERGYEILLDTSLPKIIQYNEQRSKKLYLTDVQQLKEDSFCIIKVQQQTMMNIQYVVSSHQPIIKFTNVISSQNLKRRREKYDFKQMFLSLNEDMLVNVINIIKLLAGKIYGTTYDNIGPSGNTPNSTVQKILVETGITELLIQIIFILYEPFKDIQRNNEPSEDRAIRNKVSQIFECTYKLLEKIAVGNQDNRIYLSRWVDLFLQHSNNINRSYIQECLVCILQNNPLSIEATITKQKINSLISSFFSEAQRETFLTTKYLRLFSTFIKCQDRVIKENQKIILDCFFKQKNNFWSFKFKLQEKEEQQIVRPKDMEKNSPIYDKILKYRVEIACGKQDFSSIPKFFKDWGSKWNYFLAYVNLLADICMDRNSQSIDNVSALISLQIVAVILNDPDIIALNQVIRKQNETQLQKGGSILFPISNVHQPFVRIAHYVYINNEKFIPIKKIKSISSWYKLQNDQKSKNNVENISRTKRAFQGQKEQQQKTYLMNILCYIQKFVENCDQDNNNLNILLTVLHLLKETIVLGLWENIQQFRKLIPLIIMRINKIQNNKFFDADEQTKQRNTSQQYVKKNKEKLKLNRPELNLAIECKIKATQIFKLINELEIDIRLRYMMNFFKGLYEATESFQDYNKIAEDSTQNLDQGSASRNDVAREEFLKNQSASILGEVKKISQDQDIMLKQSIWYNKVKQLTPFSYDQSISNNPSKDRYLFQGQKNSPIVYNFQEMVLAMFELPVFQNHKLLNASLKMLRQMFEQRKDMIDYFKRILICGKGNLLEVYMTLKYMRQKFNMLTNMNIDKYKGMEDQNFPYKFFQTFDSGIKQHSKRSGILQDLFFLARTLKQDINLKNIETLMLVQDNIFDKHIVYNHLNEKQKNNNLFQRVNLAQGIYVPLIQYIQIIGPRKQVPQNHRRILFGIYNYLALLCFNNLQAKQVLMQYIPDILPHLSLKVGADNFIYEVCVNNKLLVNNEILVNKIIDGALDACNSLQRTQFFSAILSDRIDKQIMRHQDYEKGKILHSLRGILLYNDEGHKHNQQLLINRLQDNKYKNLIFKGKCQYISQKKQNFALTPQQSYIANHFQLFAGLVQTQNFINIGKLQNIHPYPACLEYLKSTNRWQLRRTIRSYVNRLYYVNKDRDIFLFEQFIRKQFKIINQELADLVQLHKNKLITDQTPIPNGIRFKYALSEVLQMILQILITLHQMLLKPEFLKILDRQIYKEQKKPQNQRQIHDQFVRLLTHLGCLNKLYPKTKPICHFIKQIYRHISRVMMKFEVKYLNSKASNLDEAAFQEVDDLGLEAQKKTYVYDHSKSFFRNLNSMIRDIKAREAKQELKKKLQRRKQGTKEKQDVEAAKKDLIQQLFSVQGQTTLKPMKSKKQRREIFASQYKPHIQTANSKIFKVIAKPILGENEENIELNRRLSQVKVIIQDSPSFRKLRDDQFYKLVTTITNINTISQTFYEKDWLAVGQKKSIPVVSLKQIFTHSFNLIMRYPNQINNNQKIFIIKIARCYITEAVQGNQSYKLPVDKWGPQYYTEGELQQGQQSEFIKRQNLIQTCGGSDFIISLLSQNVGTASSTDLLNEILLLGIAYLFNGNTKCQDSLLSSLKKDVNNNMLTSIKNQIKIIGNFLIQIRKIKEGGQLRSFAYKIEDTYDYFDQKQNTIVKQFGYKSFDKFQLMAEINYQKALCRMFRFLQLFCENNNVDMKKFLLAQTNQDGNQKTNTINFIDQATLLLRKLFKVMNDKVVAIPQNILNFINQITQMPCIQNQRSFMKSTFFEDISYLADFFQDHASILLRKFNPVPEDDDDPYNQLKGIYQKGIQLALCNFEGNDNILFWQFLTKCQPKYLWICIKQNLLIMLKQKTQQWGIQKVEEQINQENKNAQTGEALLNKALLQRFNPATIQQFISSQKAKDKKFRDQILSILNVFYIIKKIEDYGHGRKIVAERDKENINKDQLDKSNKALDLRKQLILKAIQQYPHIQKFIQLFEQLIFSIQVSSNNGQQVKNQFIYFPYHPVFQYLAQNTRDDIMMRVTRQTQRDKQITLIGMKEEVKDQINLNYDLKYNKIDYTIPLIGTKIERDFPITSEFGNQVRKYARNCSFFICALMVVMILVDHDTEEQSSTFTYSNIITEVIIQIFCKIQLVLTLGFLYIWVKLRKPLALKKYENDHAATQATSGTGLAQLQSQKKNGQNEQGWQSLSKLLMIILSWFGSKLTIAKDFIAQHPLYKNTITSFVALFTYESGFLSILIFVSATFAGNFIGVQWYTIHIFDIFTDISELTNIFKAILDNIQKLTILSILAGVFILVFNVLSLSTYSHVIWQEDFPEEACQEIVDCVLVLYTSGAINDDMDEFQAGRFFFDIGYIVFMEMMFQNIVGGIMMDAFAGLKEQDQFRNQDKQTNCYICGMNKADMQKNAETFQKHVHKHFLWNYLYYILCLQQKDPTDFTGIEFDIDLKIKKENVAWFPVVQSQGQQGDVKQVFNQLEQAISGMSGYSDKMIEKSLQSLGNANRISGSLVSANNRLLE